MTLRLLTALLLILFLVGCDRSHNDGHDGHDAAAHDHTDGMDHDHSGDDEHVDRSQHLVNFSDKSELFLQYETLVAKRDSVFLAHVTQLSDYTPIPGGFITITLSGGGAPDETFSGKRPVRAGIHIEVVLPQYAGERQLSLRLNSPTVTAVHHLGTVTVYPTYAASKKVAPREIPSDTRYLEKEAQWQAGLLIQTPSVEAQQNLTLPSTAIHQNNEEKFIYVMRGAEFFERRTVGTAASHHEVTTITQGIAADERVVVRGSDVLLSKNEMETGESPTEGHAAPHLH